MKGAFELCIASVAVAACAPPAPPTGPARPADEFQYKRVYRAGDSYRYELERSDFVNEAPVDVVTAVSVHEVLGPSLGERVHFEKMTVRAKGVEKDQTPAIAAVPAYTVSLATDAAPGAMALPPLDGLDGGVVGMITDLHTFFVAVSPRAGITRLRHKGDSFVNEAAKIGSWANDATPIGQDCIQMTMRLVDLSPDTATIETSFDPPTAACLKMRAPWMEEPVSERPNNFQQVRKAPDGYSPVWGKERFVVQTVVRRSDGKILQAKMDNRLSLKAKVKCDESLTTCAGEAAVTLRRSVELRAL